MVKADQTSQIALATIFGWVVLGPLVAGPPHGEKVALHGAADHELHELLTKFWMQEEVPSKPSLALTPEEQECEAHFSRTHSRDSSGRYVVRLPLLGPRTNLGDSYETALRGLRRIQRRCTANQAYGRLYKEFLQEYEDLGHMQPASESSLGTSTIFYLPHHGVLTSKGSQPKLRVVFNGSSATSSGTSLNDLMHTGAKLQLDISDVLLRFRRFRYVFTTDIVKMFRQVAVHPADWDLQRILWSDPQGKTVSYQLTTVTYGTRSAPFLAASALLQLVHDEGHRHPLAVPPLLKGRYVDDILGGGDTVKEAEEVAVQLTQLCRAGGFPLQKWSSNCPELLKVISGDGDTSSSTMDFSDLPTRILGLSWQPLADHFWFSAARTFRDAVTKRTILSEVARLFDPLGFLAPLTIRAKILLQELWLEQLGWDEPLPPSTALRWTTFRTELQDLSDLHIPRWLNLTPEGRVEIHGFSDASQHALAAVVYLRISSSTSSATLSLVCAKTKVAPLKRLTIPRLELTAALLLARLAQYVRNTLELSSAPVHLWMDSAVALTWISHHPSRWKEFVRNRVGAIQDALPGARWKFISGRDNPADCASRGLTPTQLKAHTLWWTGPDWLRAPPHEWPTGQSTPHPDAALEERPKVTHVATVEQHPFLLQLIERCSSLTRLLRVVATCLRAAARFRRLPNSSLNNPLSPKDLAHAQLSLTRATQGFHFPSELRTLLKGGTLPRAHPLSRLTAFVDRDGILRVGGRLQHAPLDSDARHPAILPRESILADLLIKDAHLRTLHGGTQATLAHLRRSHWILGGRAPVRAHILRCVRCARFRGLRAAQLMGQLPPARVTPARAFLSTGVDYAGPVLLRTWKGRGAKTFKGWIALFVCFATSAVHLELVSDYSSDGFLAAYRRFISRRGICQTLFSDCGTNFQGADAELRRLFASASKELHELAGRLANDGTKWEFNPPAAPHFGGKWEAAVRSVKHHLRRTIGDTLLTFEELTTLLIQVEAILNSRPLCPLTEDPEDLSALTPGHFLIGDALTSVPEPSLTSIVSSRLSRWQLIQQKVQHFWTRWAAECLHNYQTISKWHHPSHELKVGSLVLLTDERLPPSKWPLARILQLHPGKDGLTRVVTLKTVSSTLQRPITKLAVLPTHDDFQASSPHGSTTGSSKAGG
ncbi:uncharacterized protein LOC123988934 [Osmia bicornis bicornis]|uniref:uncharacterized protein LOC123988934 n=1 Tax=Osmia bicornis bicornis TaxID=1437191 RepID=UPI001EAE8453|nr:uncharacterized protein LOC123988934 [Osmia bicornis bicornis]